MSATILDGKILAAKLIAELKVEVEALKAVHGKVPRCMNIVVGADASAASYGKSQKRAADLIGIDYGFSNLSAHVSQAELLDHIKFLNEDAAVHGIMVHKPLPKGIDFQVVSGAISPAKDIEGMNVTNLGLLMLGRTRIIPATPAAAMALLLSSGIDLSGKQAVVVGRSEIVGKPVTLLLLERHATVTVCHSATSKAGRLAEQVKAAEVLVVAMGRAHAVKGSWVREGAVVIDVGINEVDGKITGDVEFDEASKRAAFITPVPGGVGPVTAVMLMRNAVEIFKQQLRA
jgi:methylenetetrahydrofolate dehydrogenase (NADP+)/methenyltetrahydrofolate cyclohydrolase